MDFSQALQAMKKGYRVARASWNRGMYAEINERTYTVQSNDEDCQTSVKFIHIRTNDNQFVPWTPNQIDLLAEDWEKDGRVSKVPAGVAKGSLSGSTE
jgi:hypothetical protein